MLRVVALCFALAGALVDGASAQSPLLQRGDYLVNTILACGNCHSPKGPPAAIAGKEFSGGNVVFDEPPFTVTASNITMDKETGLGGWTDAQIKTLMRTGVRPNGVQIAGIMPTAFYGILTERDMDAVVAYLRTLKPIKNQVPDPIYKIALPHESFPGGEKPYTEAMLTDKVKKGFYLATIGHCMECHTPMGPRGREFSAKLGTGGFEFKGPWGVSVARNITQSKASGIGDWTDAEIKRAITEGKRKDGSPLKPPMAFPLYAKMTPDDLDAVVAYLRTVPAKD